MFGRVVQVMFKRLAVGLLATSLSGCAGVSMNPGGQQAPAVRIDHATVWVSDLEGAAGFLTGTVGWSRHPGGVRTAGADRSTGERDRAFIDANGFWLELRTSTSPGPGADILKLRGSGYISELAFQSRKYDEALAAMQARGVALDAINEIRLGSGRAIGQGASSGAGTMDQGPRIARFPSEWTRGTGIALIEYRPHASRDALTLRDGAQRRMGRAPNSPRLDRIAIIVADAERSARFYTDVLGLKRHPETFNLDGGTNAQSGGMQVVFIDARGIWLALVQPVGPGPLMDYLTEKGDGFVAELIAEVDDLGRFYDDMKARGIQLVDTSGAPVDDTQKAHVLAPYGDRIAYLPTSVSHGIVIEISQRGPTETSLIHKRDAWKH
jgi:catechol 2,3-dioxygenase-like lactoylglutathione lyase family enzyme